MARPKIYTDEQIKKKKAENNALPQNVERRRLNSLIYYEKKRLNKYIEKNGNEEGFIYKHIKPKISSVVIENLQPE